MSKKALFIKSGALGDLLVATAALAEIAHDPDHSEVGVFGSKLWLEILDPSQWPKIKKIFVIDARGAKRASVQIYEPKSNGWVKLSSFALAADIFHQYQITFNLRYESLRFAWGPWRARVPVRVGTCAWPFSFLYTHRAPWLGQSPLMHERERNFQILSEYPPYKNRFQNWMQETLPPLRAKSGSEQVLKRYGLARRDYLLLNPTASQRFKAWPPRRFRELMQALQSQGHKVRVIGSRQESAWLAEVCPDKSQWIQTESLFELMDLIQNARALVANASSIHFIAAGFQTPALVLMGAAKPEVWAPLGESSRYLKGAAVEGKRLDPDSQAQFEKAVNFSQQLEVQCFDSLTTEKVLQQFLELLQATQKDEV
jgi:ADP-heptose:LPS heptosyltransferase